MVYVEILKEADFSICMFLANMSTIGPFISMNNTKQPQYHSTRCATCCCCRLNLRTAPQTEADGTLQLFLWPNSA